MKHWKNFGILITFFAILSTASTNAQSNNKEIVIIRALEIYNPNAKYTGEMVVIKPDGEKYILQLNKGRITNFGEDAGVNGVIIQKEIMKWVNDGFEITSFSSDGTNLEARIFIIMTKEK